MPVIFVLIFSFFISFAAPAAPHPNKKLQKVDWGQFVHKDSIKLTEKQKLLLQKKEEKKKAKKLKKQALRKKFRRGIVDLFEAEKGTHY